MDLTLQSRVPLNDGASMPVLGLGVWQVAPRRTAKVVANALRLGYRLIDTAKIYGNEREVGEALRECGIPREEVFVTTKLATSDTGYESALRAFDASLDRLGLDYVDLYLIHWPTDRRDASWGALVEIRKSGRCRSIGVSNYTVRHLEQLRERSAVVPAVNQVEFSPFLYQRDLLEHCRVHGIVLEAYAPLARAEKMGDARLRAVAAKHRRTPAQVLLRWCLQRGTVPIPKSEDPGRQAENAAAFDFALPEEDMRRLDALDEGYRTCWDPSGVP